MPPVLYTVTVTDQYGCTGTQVFNFTVDPNPDPSIQGSTTFCSGGSTQLNVGVYSQYMWTGGATSQAITVSAPGDYYVTVTDANGCTGTDMVQVEESDMLVLNVQDTALCEGESVVLSVGSFDTYDWSTTESTPTIEVSSGGAYSVTVSDGQGCTGSATITVDEEVQPYAVVAATAEACNTAADGSTIDFSALITDGETTGIWVDIDGSGAAGAFPVLDFDGVALGTYRFEYSTNSAVAPCEDVTYMVSVTILDCACPSPDINPPAPLCADAGTLDLNTLLISGVTLPGGQWSVISTPGGSNPISLNGSMVDASGADPGVYEIQYTLSGLPGGCIDNDVQQLVVNEPADAGLAGQPGQVCVGDDSTFVLRDMLVGGQAGGIWIETSTNMSMVGFDPINGDFNTALEQPGLYTFEYLVTGVAPCPDASTTVEVYIENVPIADAGTDGTLTCDITSVVIGGPATSPGPEFRYLWTTSNGQLTDSTSATVTVKKAGTYTLMVENSNTGCRSFDDVIVMTEGDIPTDVIYDLNYPICVGEPPAVFNVQSISGGTPPYTYSLNGGGATTDGNFDNLNPGDYTLAVEDALGCKIETDFSIPVPTDIDGVIEGEFTISSSEQFELTYTVITGVADSTVWFDSEGNVLCTQCDTLYLEPTDENSLVMLTIYDPNLCSVTMSASLNVITQRDVFVPNVFSPNDDGSNDFVTVWGQQGIKVHKFEVFSRWGELVYRNTEFDANVPEEGWDGTFAGDKLQPGVFVYHAQIEYPDGYEEIIKGDITLIR